MNPLVIGIVLVVQAACALFLVSDIVISLLGLPIGPISWTFVEVFEILAAFGLIAGLLIGGFAIRDSRRRTAHAEEALRLASGAFMDVLDERFSDWNLTPAERDVALFAIKGMSIQEIARLRNTSEGTVKAQTNAIYRKASVNGRPQLLSLFIDDLMSVDA